MGVVRDADDDDGLNICVPMPVLDALSGQTREQRRLLSEAALTDRERAEMKAEGFVAIESDADADGGQPEPHGWGREPVQQVHSRRLQEIRSEQVSTDYIFPCRAFNLLVLEVSQDFVSDARFTAEAMACLQALTEDHLVRLAQEANLIAIHRGSCAVYPKDLQLARRVRGER
jgi:histone H3/H4